MHRPISLQQEGLGFKWVGEGHKKWHAGCCYIFQWMDRKSKEISLHR